MFSHSEAFFLFGGSLFTLILIPPPHPPPIPHPHPQLCILINCSLTQLNCRHRHIYLHLLGFLLYLALRVWGSTFDLIFVDITYNSLATIMGIFLSIFLYIYDYRTPVVAISSTGTTTTAAATTTTTSRGRYPGLISTAIGFGALMYLTQLIYGEVSVVTRMAVSSYPNHGPYPHPWG